MGKRSDKRRAKEKAKSRLDAALRNNPVIEAKERPLEQSTSTPKPNQPPPQKWYYRHWKSLCSLGALLLFVLAIASNLASIIGFINASYPAIAVTSQDYSEASQPFEIKFTVKNNSMYQLNDVTVRYDINEIKFRDPNRGMGNLYIHDSDEAKVLKSGEEFTIQPDMFNSFAPIRGAIGFTAKDQITGVDLTIQIFYKVPFTEIQQSESKRFIAEPTSNGIYHWYAEPLSATPPWAH